MTLSCMHAKVGQLWGLKYLVALVKHVNADNQDLDDFAFWSPICQIIQAFHHLSIMHVHAIFRMHRGEIRRF